jgi:hypothetical protein
MELHDSLLRWYAYHERKSVLTRETAAVTRQRPGLGIAPIRTAGDICIQALAFGQLDDAPTVHVFRDPHRPGPLDYELVTSQILGLLARDSGQIWIPDQDAMLVMGLEAERHRRNPDLPPHLRAFARLCDAIYRQSEPPEQQAVVMATRVLRGHLTPGQSPTEDERLGARLAWDNPVPNAHPRKVAEVRKQQGGPTLLPLDADEEIEAIQSRLLSGTATAKEQRRREKILQKAALASWRMLQEAHQVYQQLAVPDLAGLEDVAEESWKDFMELLAQS